MATGGLVPPLLEPLASPPGGGAPILRAKLLEILRTLYEHYPRPKEFIMNYRIQASVGVSQHYLATVSEVQQHCVVSCELGILYKPLSSMGTVYFATAHTAGLRQAGCLCQIPLCCTLAKHLSK